MICSRISKIGIVRKADDGERGQRSAAHRIYIAQGVGRSDLTEGERVIDQRGKEVDGLHQRLVRPNAVNSRIVRGLKPNQQIRVGLRRKRGQHLPERSGR